MGFRDTANYELGTLDATNEVTNMIYTGDFRHAVFTIIADNSFAGTIKFYSSNSEDRPDLSSSAGADNEYATVQVIKLADGSSVDGDTGLVYTGVENGIIQVEVNENSNKWLGIKMTARTAGDITAKLDLADNQ